jgi:hypothetical protein
MAIFNYTLPSGSSFQLTAAAGTTQAQADKIFYEQVAAGTFVGYVTGQTLSHPTQVLSTFGLSRLQRGTAGVDEKTLLSIVSGLPIVTPLPALNSVPIQNPIADVNYIQVTSNPDNGSFSLPPAPVGQLDTTQVQATMAQLAAAVDQHYTVMTQDAGVGKYGFNAQQLERAGYIKPGYANRYCRIDASTQKNPPQFVSFMNSPSPWTGINGVTSVNDILKDDATQNHIQEQLMRDSYNQLVTTGVIIPPTPLVTTPSVSTGQVYNSDGALAAVSALSLLASGLNTQAGTNLYNNAVSILGSAGNALGNTISSFESNPLGAVSTALSNFGTSAVAEYTAGLASLQSGAIGFIDSATSAVGNGLSQLSGLATGLTGASTAAATIASTVNSDVGALVVNASKYGTEVTKLWAEGTSGINSIAGSITTGLNSTLNSAVGSLNTLAGSITTGLNSTLGGATETLQSLSTSLSNSLDSLAKSSQFSIGFADFSLSSLVSSVQPAAAFSNTVNRDTIDAAVTRVIGSAKISSPTYELPSLASLGISADIAQAQGILASLGSAATNIGNQAVSIAGQASSTLQTQFNRITRA